MTVEVAVLGIPSLIVLTVSVDLKQHQKKTVDALVSLCSLKTKQNKKTATVQTAAPDPDRGGRLAKMEFTRVLLKLKCCFTSTETVGLLGMGAQDGHLDFHTAPEF